MHCVEPKEPFWVRFASKVLAVSKKCRNPVRGPVGFSADEDQPHIVERCLVVVYCGECNEDKQS